jgi:hypothetical protein
MRGLLHSSVFVSLITPHPFSYTGLKGEGFSVISGVGTGYRDA